MAVGTALGSRRDRQTEREGEKGGETEAESWGRRKQRERRESPSDWGTKKGMESPQG